MQESFGIAFLVKDLCHFYSNMMRSEALSSRLSSNRPIPISRLANLVADSTLCIFILVHIFLEAQINTQRYGGRPFGVGLLLAGYDENVNCIAVVFVTKFCRQKSPSCLKSLPLALFLSIGPTRSEEERNHQRRDWKNHWTH